MGFANTEKKTFVSVTDGKFWINVEPSERGKPGVVERVRGANSPKAGEPVYGRTYNCYDGIITGLATREGNYGWELHIEFDNTALIQVKLYGNYAEAFLKVLPNIDLTLPVYVQTYAFVDKKDGEKNVGWTWMQRGKKLEQGCIFRDKDGNQTKDFKTGVLIGYGETAPDKELIELPEGNKLSNVKRIKWLMEKFGTPVSAILHDRKLQNLERENQMEPKADYANQEQVQEQQRTKAAPAPARPGSMPPAGFMDDDEIPF